MPGREFYESLKHFASMADGQIPFDVDEVLELQVHHQECLDLSNAVSEFLERLVRWRTMARRMPLAYVLWAILGETGYYDYVGGLPGGAQRQANLRALVNRAIEFDGFGRHGLFRFLRFIEKIQESKVIWVLQGRWVNKKMWFKFFLSTSQRPGVSCGFCC